MGGFPDLFLACSRQSYNGSKTSFSWLAGGLADGKEILFVVTGRGGERGALAIFTAPPLASAHLRLGGGLLLLPVQEERELNRQGGAAPAS